MRAFALYYFLFMALIVGGFASMAQNDYGLKIIGFAALGFSLLFFVQSILRFRNNQVTGKWLIMLEYLILAFISFIFAMRAFFIHFDSIEIIFSLIATILAIIYAYKLIVAVADTHKHSKTFGVLIGVYNLCIILFLLSLAIVPFSPFLSEIIGGMSFGLLILFIGYSVYKKELLLKDEKINPLLYVLKFKDTSVLILITLFIFSGYIGLVKINALPQLYSSEYPQGYIRLIQAAEGITKRQVEGRYNHEVYKDNYESFIDKHIDNAE